MYTGPPRNPRVTWHRLAASRQQRFRRPRASRIGRLVEPPVTGGRGPRQGGTRLGRPAAPAGPETKPPRPIAPGPTRAVTRRPLIAMMEPANLRNRDDPATWRGFHDSWLGTVVVERLVWPRGVVIAEVAAEEPAEMRLVPDEEMIEALAAKGADDSLDTGGSARARAGRGGPRGPPVVQRDARSPDRRSCLDLGGGTSAPCPPERPRPTGAPSRRPRGDR